MCVCVCDNQRTACRSQFPPFPKQFPGSNSGHQLWQQVPSPAASSHYSYFFWYRVSHWTWSSMIESGVQWLDQLSSEFPGLTLCAAMPGFFMHVLFLGNLLSPLTVAWLTLVRSVVLHNCERRGHSVIVDSKQQAENSSQDGLFSSPCLTCTLNPEGSGLSTFYCTGVPSGRKMFH